MGGLRPLLFTSTEPTLTIRGLILCWTPPARPPPETKHFAFISQPLSPQSLPRSESLTPSSVEETEALRVATGAGLSQGRDVVLL